MTSTIREGLQTVAIATATVKGGTIKIVQIQLSLVPDVRHQFNTAYVDGDTALSADRYVRVRSASDRFRLLVSERFHRRGGARER